MLHFNEYILLYLRNVVKYIRKMKIHITIFHSHIKYADQSQPSKY